jgi:hypothetical protein
MQAATLQAKRCPRLLSLGVGPFQLLKRPFGCFEIAGAAIA